MQTPKYNLKNIIFLSLLFFLLLYLRRADQLLYPGVWNEDGVVNIPSFLNNGWKNLIEPVQGYLITVPKLITDVSLSISFIYYPEISTILTWIFTIYISLLIVYAPTVLPYRVISAIMIYMVPSYAEAYGIPLYLLWVSGIFVLLSMLWKPYKKQLLKNIILILGGLSSPIIIMMIPIQIFRILTLANKKQEFFTFLVTIGISIIQFKIMSLGNHHDHSLHGIDLYLSYLNLDFIENLNYSGFSAYFFGKYFMGAYLVADYQAWVIKDYILMVSGGFFLITLLFIALFQYRKDPYMYILFYMLFTMIGISLLRVDFIVPDNLSSRYFFFPSILLSWLLLYIMNKSKYYRLVIIPILISSVITSLQIFEKHNQDLEWRKQIFQCVHAKKSYGIPIHYAGQKSGCWHLWLSPKTCKSLVENDFFDLPSISTSKEE